MIIAVLKETLPNETRVAITPQTVKLYIDIGFKVQIESKAGEAAGFDDDSYSSSGATIKKTLSATIKNADIIIKINPPTTKEMSLFTSKNIIISNFNNNIPIELIKKEVICFALERIPRISRAQNMDILSSQNNLAGYQAVIKAFSMLPKSAPLMMTAAGTIPAAKVLILGVGVAGLQAIATAKRLGAIVFASDTRPEVKEQIESLGGRFLSVGNNNTHIQKSPKTFLRLQKKAIKQQLPQTDVVITSALTIGKHAPCLIDKNMLKLLPPNSVVIDMASSNGGNVEGSITDKITLFNHIKIFGGGNLVSELPYSASQLLAQNIFNFIKYIYSAEKQNINLNFKDEIILSTCINHNKQTDIKG